MAGVVNEELDAFSNKLHSIGLTQFHDALESLNDGDTVPISNHQMVVDEFVWWNSKLVNPELAPGDSSVTAGVRLVTGKGMKPDIAVMNSTWRSKPCLIAQTGGMESKAYVCFPHETDFAKLTSSQQHSELKTMVESALAGTISVKDSNFALERFDDLWVATLFAKKRNAIKIALNNSFVCIQIPKYIPGDSMPSYSPKPENWFAEARKTQDENKSLRANREKTEYEKDFEKRLGKIKGNRKPNQQ
jgi:hypothetical protein